MILRGTKFFNTLINRQTMKPQELNQEEQKHTNGGFLTQGLPGSSNNSGGHNTGSDSRQENNGEDENNASSGLLGDVPLVGDML